ncbi:unnamed protein product [Owenia fusiformis]|uniref:Uncharacterized protein n=1 Tax=Owenia fusiformis TaxID=6347 RepID=A0A8J1U5J8_OWEFU|nr:unnamed protein product [Owenia fusiformis]
MGNYLSRGEPETPVRKGKKRKLQDDTNIEQTDITIDLDTPKRKKLKCTAKYIYETLFINGENSDITIAALGKEWNLHRVYIRQSGYFASMFSGSWMESTLDRITMDIPDENIDVHALEVAFGSLYRDDVSLVPARVTSVLAAASLLQLDDLVHQCGNIMEETISAKTVNAYYTASVTYGQHNAAKKCKIWLERNLLNSPSITLLRKISPELMTATVGSPNLFVMQVEMDVYSILKKWMFLHVVPSYKGSSKPMHEVINKYFKEEVMLSEYESFLETEQGKSFCSTFKQIRFQHIISDLDSAQILEKDNIVPKAWLMSLYRTQWKQMLRVEHGKDLGPQEEMIPEFPSIAMRCGRILQKDGYYCWRWTGHSYGVDLLISFHNKLIIFKRNVESQNSTVSVSLCNKRTILYKLTIASLDKHGQASYKKSTKVTKLSLEKDEEQVVIGVDRHAKFPLHISVNILSFSPSQSSIDLYKHKHILPIDRSPMLKSNNDRSPSTLRQNTSLPSSCGDSENHEESEDSVGDMDVFHLAQNEELKQQNESGDLDSS